MARGIRDAVAEQLRVKLHDMDSSISSGWLASSAVATANIAANAVTQAKISNLSWGTAACDVGKIYQGNALQTTFSVSGAVVGNAYIVQNSNGSIQACVSHAWCETANWITVRILNSTDVATVPSQTLTYFQIGA